MKSNLSLFGGVFVLVILVILSMVSFSVLGLMSAAADLRLSRTCAQWTYEYYLLEGASNEKIFRANTILSESYNERDGEFSQTAFSRLSEEGWTVSGNTARCDVTTEHEKRQNMNIELVLSPPDNNGRYYKISRFQQWQDKFEYNAGGIDIWQGI